MTLGTCIKVQGDCQSYTPVFLLYTTSASTLNFISSSFRNTVQYKMSRETGKNAKVE